MGTDCRMVSKSRHIIKTALGIQLRDGQAFLMVLAGLDNKHRAPDIQVDVSHVGTGAVLLQERMELINLLFATFLKSLIHTNGTIQQ